MIYDFIIFFLILSLGVLLIAFISQYKFFLTLKNPKKFPFSFIRYSLLMLFPIIAVIITYKKYGFPIIKVFIAFSIIGLVLEWLIGFSYQMIVGERLWTYHKYQTIGKYSSFLTIPIWGMAGVLFWLLSQIFV